MEGVQAVMTGEDLVEPGNQMLGSGEGAIALKDLSPMVMSRGKVLFHAQAVSAVAATPIGAMFASVPASTPTLAGSATITPASSRSR